MKNVSTLWPIIDINVWHTLYSTILLSPHFPKHACTLAGLHSCSRFVKITKETRVRIRERPKSFGFLPVPLTATFVPNGDSPNLEIPLTSLCLLKVNRHISSVFGLAIVANLWEDALSVLALSFLYFSKMATFSLQDQLPSLPVPSLDETLDKYLKSGEYNE